MDKKTCCYCPDIDNPNLATTTITHEDGFIELVCQSCLDHIYSDCADEECPICPSGVSLDEALEMARLLGVKVTLH